MRADDYFAIQRLINLYFDLIDAADFDAVGALFDQAEMIYPDTGRTIASDGRALAELMRSYVRLHGESGLPLTRHLGGNIIIEPDGESRAKASCSAIIFQAAPGFPLQPIAEARYCDRFAVRDGAWFFTRREMRLRLQGDLSQHLLRPTSPEATSRH